MSKRETMTTSAGVPKRPMHHDHKVGAMRFVPNNPNPDTSYEPNSFNGPVEDKRFDEPPLKISGDVGRYDHRDDNDDCTQAGNLFRLLDGHRERLCRNVAEALGVSMVLDDAE